MISGVYVPLLTAFASDGAVAPGPFGQQAEWLASRGVDGLVPFGSTGEGPSLSLREKRVLLEALATAVPGLPAVPAVTDPSLDGALRLHPGRRPGPARLPLTAAATGAGILKWRQGDAAGDHEPGSWPATGP